LSNRFPFCTVSLLYSEYVSGSLDIVFSVELVNLILPIRWPFFMGACRFWVLLISLLLKFWEIVKDFKGLLFQMVSFFEVVVIVCRVPYLILTLAIFLGRLISCKWQSCFSILYSS